MAKCDAGRCCKDGACTDSQKCCCQSDGGSFTAGEVCRTAACIAAGGCSYVDVCACDSSGGTLAQDCDPCLSVTCNPFACQECKEGKCVSNCTACQDCIVDGLSAGCVKRFSLFPCAICVEVDGQAAFTAYGYPCGDTCCDFGQCCIDGQCQDLCTGCNQCVNGACVPISGEECGDTCCQAPLTCCGTECCPEDRACCMDVCCDEGQVCCGGDCAECNADSDCDDGYICVGCECVQVDLCFFDNHDCTEPSSITAATGGCPASYDTVGPGGNACHVTIQSITCDDIKCTYEWSSPGVWSLVGGTHGSYYTGFSVDSNGLVTLPGSTPCSCDTCPSTLSAPAPTGPPYTIQGAVCTPGRNPLP